MNLQEIVIATGNRGKFEEFRSLLSRRFKVIHSLDDYKKAPAVKEDGKDFSENAYIKARTVSEFTGLPAIGDDSGLVVDALGGRPGIRSARYAGEDVSDDHNIDKLLKELENVDNRNARFVCSLVLCSPEGIHVEGQGFCEGIIIDSRRGGNGFGYDPVFLLPSLGKTMAEITPEQKNRLSHRAKAVESLLGKLDKAFG